MKEIKYTRQDVLDYLALLTEEEWALLTEVIYGGRPLIEDRSFRSWLKAKYDPESI